MKNIFCFRVFNHGKCSLLLFYNVVSQSKKSPLLCCKLIGIIKLDAV